jgi:hypothetical protein
LSSEIRILQNRDRSRLLRLEALDEVALNALAAGDFDGVEVTADFGGFEPLAPWQSNIRWLFAPQPTSADGLALLESLERISFVGSQLGYDFDYRRLPRLRVLECGSAAKIPAKYLDHPHLEVLDIAGGNLKDFSALPHATALRAVLLEGCKTKSLAGIGALTPLRELRLLDARSLVDLSEMAALQALEVLVITAAVKLLDTSAIQQLPRLRCLHVEAKTASVADLGFVAAMPGLEILNLWAPVERIDWPALASHPNLCQIGLQLAPGQQFDADDVIRDRFAAAARTVRTLTKFSGASPQIKLELDPPAGRHPGPALGNNLRRMLTPLAHARF